MGFNINESGEIISDEEIGMAMEDEVSKMKAEVSENEIKDDRKMSFFRTPYINEQGYKVYSFGSRLMGIIIFSVMTTVIILTALFHLSIYLYMVGGVVMFFSLPLLFGPKDHPCGIQILEDMKESEDRLISYMPGVKEYCSKNALHYVEGSINYSGYKEPGEFTFISKEYETYQKLFCSIKQLGDEKGILVVKKEPYDWVPFK